MKILCISCSFTMASNISASRLFPLPTHLSFMQICLHKAPHHYVICRFNSYHWFPIRIPPSQTSQANHPLSLFLPVHQAIRIVTISICALLIPALKKIVPTDPAYWKAPSLNSSLPLRYPHSNHDSLNYYF